LTHKQNKKELKTILYYQKNINLIVRWYICTFGNNIG